MAKLFKKKKSVITVVCLCGSEWDFESPITLLNSRIVYPITTSYSTSISVAGLKPKKGKK